MLTAESALKEQNGEYEGHTLKNNIFFSLKIDYPELLLTLCHKNHKNLRDQKSHTFKGTF
jgi:hypothetical protein